LLPTFSHPFDKALAPFDFRVELCQVMTEALGAWARICRIEEELPIPSYTVDTLTVLSQRYPEHTFRLVVGADVLQQVDEWKDWRGICERFSPILVGRQGYPTPEGAIDFPGVSSTEIRERLAAGQPVNHLVLGEVAERLVGATPPLGQDQGR
jgi:nicotinate-nucleotide adenylyltransferase